MNELEKLLTDPIITYFKINTETEDIQESLKLPIISDEEFIIAVCMRNGAYREFIKELFNTVMRKIIFEYREIGHGLIIEETIEGNIYQKPYYIQKIM